jgi:hypothetical protein
MAKRVPDPDIPLGVIPGYLLGCLILVGLLYVSYALQESHPERYFNMLLLPGGGIAGWVVGIFLSPRGQQQQRQFETLGRAIGTFISGFLLAKLAPLFEHLVSGEGTWNLTLGVRLLIVFVSFLLGLLFVFIGRTQTTQAASVTTEPIETSVMPSPVPAKHQSQE